MVAYDRKPEYTRYAPGQLTTFSALLGALDKAHFVELRNNEPPSTSEGIVLGRT